MTITHDYQAEPKLSDQEWKDRFATHMIKLVEVYHKKNGATFATDEDNDEEAWTRQGLEDYARNHAAPEYLRERNEYVSPEEAADTDMSYWD